jgi:hypothetical protein
MSEASLPDYNAMKFKFRLNDMSLPPLCIPGLGLYKHLAPRVAVLSSAVCNQVALQSFIVPYFPAYN